MNNNLNIDNEIANPDFIFKNMNSSEMASFNWVLNETKRHLGNDYYQLFSKGSRGGILDNMSFFHNDRRDRIPADEKEEEKKDGLSNLSKKIKKN